MDLQGIRGFFWGPVAVGTTTTARRDGLIELGCDLTTGTNWGILMRAGRLAKFAARRFELGPIPRNENAALLHQVQHRYDFIWIEKGIYLLPETLLKLKDQTDALIHFTPDMAFHPITRTRRFLAGLPIYDACGTTKPDEVDTYSAMGAKKVVLLPKSYSPRIHKPYPADGADTFQSDIVFSGTWTALKEATMAKVQARFPNQVIKIWGQEWVRKSRNPNVRRLLCGNPQGTFGTDYGRSLAGGRVALGLLATDLFPTEVITDRIIEIPACGALLIAPRTPAIEAIFEDGREALLYTTDEEMLAKIEWALTHEDERRVIAGRAHAKVTTGPYQDRDIVGSLLTAAIHGGPLSVRRQV